jgi:hypothetical protein
MDYDEEIARMQKRRASMMTVLFAIMGGLGTLVALTILTWGMFLYVIPVVGGIAGFVLINYFLWGRGMLEQTIGEREEEELRASMERPPWELSETEQPRHL